LARLKHVTALHHQLRSHTGHVGDQAIGDLSLIALPYKNGKTVR